MPVVVALRGLVRGVTAHGGGDCPRWVPLTCCLGGDDHSSNSRRSAEIIVLGFLHVPSRLLCPPLPVRDFSGVWDAELRCLLGRGGRKRFGVVAVPFAISDRVLADAAGSLSSSADGASKRRFLHACAPEAVRIAGSFWVPA